MSTELTILIVFIGLLVLVVDVMLCYGAITFWEDYQKSLAITFIAAIVAITAAYVNTVISILYE